LHRPALLPVPAFAVRLMLGEFAEVVLGGQKALPTVALRTGYRFRFSEVQNALEALLRNTKPSILKR